MGHTSGLLFGIYWLTWKTNIYLKKLLKWANEKCKNFDIYNVVFFKKRKEKHLEISLFYIFVSKILMIWSTVFEIWVWLTKIGNYGHFLTFNPFMPLKNPKSQNFEKMKENAGDVITLHKCTRNHNHMRCGSWDMEWDR